MFVEELEAAQGDAAGGAGVGFDVFQEEEITAQLLCADFIRRLVLMLGQLPDGADIHLLGALRHALQLQVLDHALL